MCELEGRQGVCGFDRVGFQLLTPQYELPRDLDLTIPDRRDLVPAFSVLFARAPLREPA